MNALVTVLLLFGLAAFIAGFDPFLTMVIGLVFLTLVAFAHGAERASSSIHPKDPSQ